MSIPGNPPENQIDPLPASAEQAAGALKAEFLPGMHAIEAGVWDGLMNSTNPFSSHAFLAALEDSGSVGAETGWLPKHLLLRAHSRPVAVMPAYEKAHSYGEFVFDWGWAEAYARHGYDYYPKLLSAIPFVPSTGPRLGIAAGQDPQPVLHAVSQAMQAACREEGRSGWHLLFPDAPLQDKLALEGEAMGLLGRQDIQFHWHNRAYATFDDFLAGLRASRRKNLRKERRKVTRQGVVMQRQLGADISAQDWHHFYHCYVNTFLKRSGHTGYMTEAFFTQLLETLRDQLMLVTARQQDEVVASALFLFDDEALYGRYWGALRPVDCLHFEACFYQGIEFCIERGLQRFDPGTQGEHKLMRGFEPVTTRSYHWIKDPRFRAAIADFLQREKDHSERYGEEAEQFLPYRRDGKASKPVNDQ